MDAGNRHVATCNLQVATCSCTTDRIFSFS